MTTVFNTICSVCEYQNETKEAEHWCPECEQGLCPNCLKYHNALQSSRNHEVIPVENYKQLPSSISSIQQHCSDHDRKFQMFCPEHENLCCPLCISSKHRNCVGLLSIEEVIETSKTSSLFDSMEQRLSDVMTNAEKILHDRKLNLTSIQNQHRMFQSEITLMRDKINKHLDLLVKQSSTDVQATEKKISKQIETVITNVTQHYKDVSALKKEIASIRKYASNLQTFLGGKVLHVEIQKKEEFLQAFSVDGSLQQVFLYFEVNEEVSGIPSFQKFGSVSTERRLPLVELKRETDNQAQILKMPVATRRSIEDIKLMQEHTEIVPGKMTGCSINLSNKCIFANYFEHQLIILAKYANSDSVIKTSTRFPIDVTCIDENTVAVSFHGAAVIQIINIKSHKVVKTINTLGLCSGITHQRNKMFCCEFSKGIRVFDLLSTDNFLLINDKSLENWNYITTSMDKLYYTNKNVVYCYSWAGKKLWEFKDATLLINISSLTIDKHCNIYVASRGNNSIVVIAPDGEKGRRILGKEDGIIDPCGVSIDAKNYTLLVTNYNGTAFLYKANITQNETIMLFIKGCDGSTKTLYINSDAKISELSSKIAEKIGLKKGLKYAAVYGGKDILSLSLDKPEASIEDFNISKCATIQVILKLLSCRKCPEC